jgi:hypothetical protein
MKEISSQFGIEFAEPRSTIKTIASNHHNAKMNPLLIHYGSYLKKLDDGAAIYNVDLNRHFALPGNLKYRGQLISGPMPPLVKFENGSWALQKLMRRIFVREVGDEEIWDQLAAISQSIHDRWRKYRIAVATK